MKKAINNLLLALEKHAASDYEKSILEAIDVLDRLAEAIDKTGNMDVASVIDKETAKLMQHVHERSAGFGDRSLNSLIAHHQKRIVSKLSREGMDPQTKKAAYIALRESVMRHYKRASQKLKMVQADLNFHYKHACTHLAGDHLPDTDDLAEHCSYVQSLSEVLAF